MAYTTTELITYCLQNGWTDQTSEGQTALLMFINDMIQRLARAREWVFYRKPYVLSLKAPSTTSTVTLIANDATVTAAAAAFASTMVGQEFYTSTDSARLYMVSSYTSTVSLELTSDYIGTAGAGKSYEVRYVRYSLPSDFDRPFGIMTDQSGAKLNPKYIGLDEWYQKRMEAGGTTASYPTHIAVDRGGPSQAGTHYVYVHPAPSAARMIRGVYQAIPATVTSVVAPDWPEKHRDLLHALLKWEVSNDSPRPGAALALQEFQMRLDQAYNADSMDNGPWEIRPGRGRSVQDEAAALLGRIHLDGK